MTPTKVLNAMHSNHICMQLQFTLMLRWAKCGSKKNSSDVPIRCRFYRFLSARSHFNYGILFVWNSDVISHVVLPLALPRAPEDDLLYWCTIFFLNEKKIVSFNNVIIILKKCVEIELGASTTTTNAIDYRFLKNEIFFFLHLNSSNGIDNDSVVVFELQPDSELSIVPMRKRVKLVWRAKFERIFFF